MLTESDWNVLRENWISAAKDAGIFPIELKEGEITSREAKEIFKFKSTDEAYTFLERMVQKGKAEIVHESARLVGRQRPCKVYRLKDKE